MKALMLAAGTAALLYGISTAAGAATTASFQVKLKIEKNCTIDSVGDLDFGTQTFLTANVDATTSLTVNCTKGTSATVTLSGAEGARSMTNGTDTISYELYSDSARTAAWDFDTGVTISGKGVDASGASLDNSTATGTTRTIYGRVPAQSTATTGDYADTITATVSF